MKTRAKRRGSSLTVNPTKGVGRKNRSKPAQQKVYTLTELLRGVTKINIHREVDSGPPQGRELL